MDRYVEALLLGADTRSEFARLVLHLRRCVACREDTEGLLAAIESLGLLPRAK